MWYKFAQNNIDIPLPDVLKKILSDIKNNNGKPYLCGGIVRDKIYNQFHGAHIKPKDYDVEVYGINSDKLIRILSKFGEVNEVGKSFGVIKLSADNDEYDFSLPRKDSKTGAKHTDFEVNVDENLSPEDALARRDVTVNALLWDPFSHEIIDPYSGVKDIKNKVLRHTSSAFSEDPLRVLRLMSLASRFGFSLAPETAELAKSIKDQYSHLPKERIEQEFHKLVTKGIEPGIALDILYKTGWSENLPHIHKMQGIKQNPVFHPEGDLPVHTKLVMNEAARIADRDGLSKEEREVLVYAALCHDFGKITHTFQKSDKNGNLQWVSPGHEEAGMEPARDFLESIGVNKKIIDRVVPLVGNHMQHLVFPNVNSKDSFVKKLAEKLHPSDIAMLNRIIESDHSGRHPLPKELPSAAEEMGQVAKTNQVLNARAPNLLEGKDVIKYTGQGGKYIGDILNEHRNLILNHSSDMKDRNSALEWLDRRMKNQISYIKGNDVQEFLGVKGPEIKNILDRAWIAQKNHEFNDRNSAIEWLKNLKRNIN